MIHEINDIVSIVVVAVEEQSATTEEIAENTSQASLGILEVTENVAQLSTVANEVAADINNVSEYSNATTRKALDVKGSGQSIEDIAVELAGMVSKIKL